MKTAFVKNGVVIGVGVSGPQLSVSSADEEVIAHPVDDSLPIAEGWLVTVTGGVTAFAAPPATLALMSPTAFYLAFTPSERIAIKSSDLALVKEFWETFQIALQNGSAIDPNLVSVRNSLGYLAQPEVGILATPERVGQILNGTPE